MNRLKVDTFLYIFASVCDIVITYLVLFHFNSGPDGHFFQPHVMELNPFAKAMIKWLGVGGMIAYKSILVLIVISVAHYIEGKEKTGIAVWITPKVILRLGVLYTITMLITFLMLGMSDG